MSTAIRDVGETLIELLRSELVPGVVADADRIALLSPAEVTQPGGVVLSLFLYSIMPVAEMRNEFEIPGLSGGPPSQPLDLYYLLTAFAQPGNDRTEQNLGAHHVLGAAMRVFFDHGTVTGSLLRGAIPRSEEIRITYQPMTVEDLTRLWSVFPESVLRTSVSYLVTPVRLISLRQIDSQPVQSRRTDTDPLIPAVS